MQTNSESRECPLGRDWVQLRVFRGKKAPINRSGASWEDIGRVDGDEELVAFLLKDSALEGLTGSLLLVCSQLLHQLSVHVVILGRNCSVLLRNLLVLLVVGISYGSQTNLCAFA